jgi:hypothetical protein
MAFTIHITGERDALTKWIGAENLILHLYANNYTPAEGDPIGSYTEVSGVGTGYAAITLVAATWGAAATDGANHSTKAYAAQTFTFVGAGCPVTVYGYYITTLAGVLVGGHKEYATGQVFPAGATCVIVPVIELGNGTPT